MVQVKKEPTRPCFRFGQQFKSMFSFRTFLWPDSESLGGSSQKKRLRCAIAGLVFTFTEPKIQGEHVRIQKPGILS